MLAQIRSFHLPNPRILFARHWKRAVWVVPAFCLFWLDLISFPLSPVGPETDSSWCGALIYFAARGLQFGKDVVFTYGPFGHLISFVYTGDLFGSRISWELASETLFAGLFCIAMLRLQPMPRAIFFLFVLLFVRADPIADALYFIVIASFFAVLLLSPKRPAISLLIVAAVLIAIASLIKFTYFVLALFFLLNACAFYVAERQLKRAALMVAAYVLSALLCWAIAHQQFTSVWSYLRNSLEITIGYKNAMGIPASSVGVVFAGLTALTLSFAQYALNFWSRRSWRQVFPAMFFAGATFLSWNRAFIRADDHVLSFFATCAPILLLSHAGLHSAARRRGLINGLSILVVVACITGIYLQRPTLVTGCLTLFSDRTQLNWSVLRRLPHFRRDLDQQLSRAKAIHALPRVKTAVGKATIDVFGYEQGVALLNELNYTPRPVFQGYSAYTSALAEMNGSFYASRHAPSYVLLKLQPLDERYPTLDDARTLLEILYNYAPLFNERGYSLWKRIDNPQPIQLHTIITRTISFGEEVTIPSAKPAWLELAIDPSPFGFLVGALYKPPITYISAKDRYGTERRYRLITEMARCGFIINPELEAFRDLLYFVAGRQTVGMESFTISSPLQGMAFFHQPIQYRLATLPKPLGLAPEEAAIFDQKWSSGLDNDLPQARLGALFNASNQVLFQIGADNAFRGISAANQVRLTTEEHALKITASGDDPQILLPSFSPDDKGRIIVRVELDSPSDTGFQVFYLPSGVHECGAYVVNRYVRRGKNTIYFALDASDLSGGPIRIDPGMTAGEYMLYGIEARLVRE